MVLKFSEAPGAFERQLQRRYQNPLFPPAVAAVTGDELDAARRRDQEERRSFQASLRATLREALDMPPQVDSDVLLKLKERLDQLYDQCAGLPGDWDREKQSLMRMIGVIMQAVWAGAGDDPRARSELEQEEHARMLHHELLLQPLVAHLLRPDSPIGPDELVPTLLSETPEAVNTAFALFDPAQQQALCAQARALLEKLQAEGKPLPAAWQRLQLMEDIMRREALNDPAASS